MTALAIVKLQVSSHTGVTLRRESSANAQLHEHQRALHTVPAGGSCSVLGHKQSF